MPAIQKRSAMLVVPAKQVRDSDPGDRLRHVLHELRAAAREFRDASLGAPDAWKGARVDVETFTALAETVAEIGKGLTLNRARVAGVDAEKLFTWDRSALRALAPVLRKVLRPAGVGAPIRGRELLHDLRDVPPLLALHRMPWSNGEPEFIGTVDERMTELSPSRRVAWLIETGWKEAPVDRIVEVIERLLARHGRLLQRVPAPDLPTRLRDKIEAQRNRSSAAERRPDNFLAAVLRAYGFTKDEAKSRARLS